MRNRLTIVVMTAIMTVVGALGAVAFGGFGPWGVAESIESFGAGAHENFNTPSLDGCPFISPDGKMFFMASNRPGGVLDDNGNPTLDIWVSTRASESDPWGEPVNLGPPINTKYRDFCPTIGRDGKTFFFASDRPIPEACGMADLYTTRFDSNMQVTTITHLGCVWDGGVNSAYEEHSPFPAEIPGEGKVLFYSSTRLAGDGDAAGDHDLYMSPRHGGVYGVGVALSGINTTADEGQPNVRRDGQELFFYSNRTGNNDIYSAAKDSPTGQWGPAQNLGGDVNSGASETRPSLSWDGTTLYFGTTRVPGQSSDIFVTTR